MKKLAPLRSLRSAVLLTILLVLGTSCGSDSSTAAGSQDAATAVPAEAVATTAPVVVEADPTAATVDPTAEPAAPAADPTAAADATTSAADDGATGVLAVQWADNVQITMGDGVFRFESDGLPSHELPDQFLVPNEGNMPPFDGDNIEDEFYVADTADLITASPIDVEITLTPVYSDEVTQTSLSTIGVMISGAQLFNDYEDQTRQNIALDDNISLGGAFFIDACNGHPLADGSAYHYHGVPYCITDAVDVAGQHSTIIGILLDGFGIYGPQDVDGTSLTNADLDECSGHVGVTPDSSEPVYHYHLTEDENPYSIDCFHGVIDYGGGNAGGGGGPGGERPDGPPDGERPDGPPEGAAEGDAPADGGPPEGETAAAAEGERPEGPPADAAEGDAPADGGPGGGGPPDLTDAAATLGVSVDALTAALGQPPFDLEAVAATLGVTVAELEAALPAPPEGGGGRP